MAEVKMQRLGATFYGGHATGFSMIELMVVLGIASILLGIGAPSFQALIQNQKVTTTVNDLFASINLARSEAIQRGTRVDLVPVDGSSDWTKGWVVFIDKNNNQKPENGEQIIYSRGPVPAGLNIATQFTDSKVQYLAYNGTGRTHINGYMQKPQAGSFSFSWNAQVKKKIIVNFLGRPKVCNPATESATC